MGDQFSLAVVPDDMPPAFRPDPEKGRVENLYDELHDFYAKFKEFEGEDPITIFQILSAASARASEMRSMMLKVSSQRATSFRTKHIDPFIEECDRQFKVQSRIVAIMEMDAKLSGGRFT